jgi:glycosyltransferase involved in cell wall biosynthesis
MGDLKMSLFEAATSPTALRKSGASLKTVGLQRRWYPEVRCIANLNTDRVKFIDVASDFSNVAPDLIRAMRSVPLMRQNTAAPAPTTHVDCYHFFNTIPLNNTPFVCSFESELPRWHGVDVDTFCHGLEILAADNCRQLFAISRHTAEMARSALQRAKPNLLHRVMSKLQVLYPPQPLSTSPTQLEKFDRPTLEFAFVGIDFLRKGGHEALLAFERVLARGADIKLHLVTPLKAFGSEDNIAWNKDARRKLAHCEALIERYPTKIDHVPELPNEEVLALFERSHILWLPSYQETFGYVVLEAQSRRCTALTSNQRAFPEINNNDIGSLLDLPIDHNKLLAKVDHGYFADLSHALQERLYDDLTRTLSAGVRGLREKADRAYDRIRREHDPVKAADVVYPYY